MKPYFPVALDLAGRTAVVAGGNDEAVDKARKLVGAGARVVVAWPEVDPRLEAMAEAGEVTWVRRVPEREDLSGARVVVLAEIDRPLAVRLHALAAEEGFWLCAIDQPDHCDWVNLAQIEAGPVRIALGSSGGAPGLLKRLREDLSRAFDERFSAFAGRLARFREGLSGLPSAERRRRLALAIEGFRLEIRVRYPKWESDPEGEPPP